MQVSARVTVTPANLGLRRTLDDFIARRLPQCRLLADADRARAVRARCSPDDLETHAGRDDRLRPEYERRVLAGERYPFANMVNALREIHRGTHRPYPCGAGAGYLGVSADGELSACHRFVGDEEGAMGSLADGIDRDRQAELAGRRATCTGRSPAGPAGRATSAAAAAITK